MSYAISRHTLGLKLGERKTDFSPTNTNGKQLNLLRVVKCSSHCIAETACLYWNSSDRILGGTVFGTLPSFNSGGQNVPTSWQLKMNVLSDKFQPFSPTDRCTAREANTITSSLPEALWSTGALWFCMASTYITLTSKITSQSPAVCVRYWTSFQWVIPCSPLTSGMHFWTENCHHKSICECRNLWRVPVSGLQGFADEGRENES